jgi:hypothetical protein
MEMSFSYPEGDRKLTKRILGQSTVPWVQFQMVLRDITGSGGSEKSFVGP